MEILNELNNENFISKIELEKQKKIDEKKEKEHEKIQKKNEKEQNKMEKEHEKIQKKNEKEEKKNSKKDNEDLNFMDAVIDKDDLGENSNSKKNKVLKKLLKYKESFKEELVNIKINKNDTVEKLEETISQCQDILETTWIDAFLTDVFFQLIETVEPMTYQTKFNIRNLSKELKKNPQVTNLLKQCALKYGSYCQVSCEYSLIMAICATTYTTILANNMNKIGVQNQEQLDKSRESIHTFLNKKI